MTADQNKPVCCVESENDLHVVVHLLKRHGVDWPPNNHPVNVKKTGNDQGVLNSIRDEIDGAKDRGRAAGFIIDIDTDAPRRWTEVRNILLLAGANPPAEPVEAGYIEDMPQFQTRVGVWLMPDNKLEAGKLENLLSTLVPAGDALIEHAKSATKAAKGLGAKFNERDTIKAELHSWLAWQETPGMPYGNAISFKYFQTDSPAALSFVKWFRELYRI